MLRPRATGTVGARIPIYRGRGLPARTPLRESETCQKLGFSSCFALSFAMIFVDRTPINKWFSAVMLSSFLSFC